VDDVPDSPEIARNNVASSRAGGPSDAAEAVIVAEAEMSHARATSASEVKEVCSPKQKRGTPSEGAERATQDARSSLGAAADAFAHSPARKLSETAEAAGFAERHLQIENTARSRHLKKRTCAFLWKSR